MVTAAREVAATRSRLPALPDDESRMLAIDNALCRGYAAALAGDAWLADSRRRLHELIDDDSLPVRRDLRVLTGERSKVERNLTTLRHDLAELRLEHDHLRARSPTSSA